ncbi:MAG: peptidylprolyl isomerase [Xanthomonadaceae bacterium]|nr:peptidylprolyl isomerase [Xanthomonadaceae bacterium]
MIRSLRSLTLAVLLVGSFSAFAQQPLDRIAAVVDEDVILQSELDRAVVNIRAQYAGREAQLPPVNVLQRQVLERLILIKLQTASAERTGLRVSDEEVNAAVANIARQNNLSSDQLRQQLARDGISLVDFRNSLREEITVQRLRQRFAQQQVDISEAEVDAAMAVQGSGSAQYRLSHILVALPEGATAEQIATGEKKIEGIKALLDKGEMEFSAAAVRYSDSPNALEGGDLGWRSLDQVPTSFGNTIRTMQRGQIVGPIRGPSGFQLIKLEDVRSEEASGTEMATQYQARHILVRTPENGDDAAAKAKIDTLLARVRGGADFAEVASKESEDTASKPRGGDLGWFGQDDFGPEFGKQVSALTDGQVSTAFKTQSGWHIVQRIASRQINATNENRRAKAREAIGQRKFEAQWDTFLRQIRGEAFIDIRVGADAAGKAG